MGKLKGMLIATIFAVIATPLFAGSDDFAGPYIGITGSTTAVELDGSSTDSNSQVQKGKAGMFAIAAGAELGYSVPVSDVMLVTIGVSMNPGDAKFKVEGGGSANTTNSDVTVDLSDLMTAFIAPTFAISESAAVYFKVGYTEADLSVKGDVTKVSSIEGTTVAIGTKSLLPNGVFIQTEAGMTEYDQVKFTGLGTYIATTNSATVDPTQAYGSVTLGYKF